MRRLHLALLLVGLLLFALPASAADNPPAKVSDLAWMTGHWEGAAMGGTLEENWSEPKDGSIASLVRATGNGATSMIELIVIEEEEGSLTLRLQQWNPGFEPRTPGPQVMRLVEIGDKKVVFENTGEGTLGKLGYSSPEEGKFVISITTPTGQSFDIPLSR